MQETQTESGRKNSAKNSAVCLIYSDVFDVADGQDDGSDISGECDGMDAGSDDRIPANKGDMIYYAVWQIVFAGFFTE